MTVSPDLLEFAGSLILLSIISYILGFKSGKKYILSKLENTLKGKYENE